MPHSYLPPEPPCTHPRKGTVRAGDTTATVCDRSACIAATMRWACATAATTLAQHTADIRDAATVTDPALLAAWLREPRTLHERDHAFDQLVTAVGFEPALSVWHAADQLAAA